MKRSIRNSFWAALSILPLFAVGYGTLVRLQTSSGTNVFESAGEPWGILLLIMPSILVLTFMVHAWNNPRLPREKRPLWLALLLFGHGWVLPFYFWYYMAG